MPPKLYPSRLEQVSDAYEQRYLYKFGRYLWNFLGICGVAATGIGGVYAMSGEAFWIPGKEAKILERKDTAVLNYSAWFKRNCPNFVRDSNQKSTVETRASDGRLCHAAHFKITTKHKRGDWCYSTNPSGKRVGSGKYINGICDGDLTPLRSYQDLLHKGKNLYREYKDNEEAMVSKKSRTDSTTIC